MKDIVEGFRKVVQDLLVPELKAVQVEVKHLREDFQRLDARMEKLEQQFKLMHEEILEIKIGQKQILQKIEEKIDVERRLTKLETALQLKSA